MVDRDQTSGLRVSVTSQLMQMPKTMTEMPVYEEEELHVEITDSRPSGVGFADVEAERR